MDDPDHVGIRYLGVRVGLLRQATEDSEVDGLPIAAGDSVVAAVQSAEDRLLCIGSGMCVLTARDLFDQDAEEAV